MKKSFLIIAMGIFGTAAFAQDASTVESQKLKKDKLKHVEVESEVKTKSLATKGGKTQITPITKAVAKPTELKTKLVKKEVQK